MITKSWKKIFPDISEDEDFAGFEDDVATSADLAQLANTVPGGENVDQDNINEWFEVDANMPAFEVLTDKILLRAQGIAESESGSVDEGEGSDECVSIPKSHTGQRSICLLYTSRCV